MFNLFRGLFMCLPFYTKCKTCKFVHFVSPTKAKCRHFIMLNNPYFLDDLTKEFCEDELYLDVEIVRTDENLCGRNATYYTRRIQ